jgi:putative endonuclease
MAKNKTSWSKGIWAEGIASLYLQLKGYKILAKRYKTPVGEIDLIAFKKQILVFVEVKKRGSFDDAISSLQAKQRRRIEKTARFYMAKHPCDGECRFDMIAFGRSLKPKHLINAWIENE